MKHITLLLTILLSIFLVYSQDLSQFDLEAHYPFSSDGTDATTTYANANLNNATFSSGGIYSNGLYSGTDPTGTDITTPQITGLDQLAMAVQLDFNSERNNNYIFVAGFGWRWVQIYSNPSGNLECFILLQQGQTHSIYTTTAVALNQWHNVAFTYNPNNLKFELYFNNALIETATLAQPIEINGDLTFTNQHPGAGFAYKGFWKDLKLYKSLTVGINDIPEDPSLAVYPIPAMDYVKINSDNYRNSTFSIYTLTGQQLMEGQLMRQQTEIPISNLPFGTYLLRISNEKYSTTRKLIVSK